MDSILTKVGKHFDLPGITATVSNLDSLNEYGVYGVSNNKSGELLTYDKWRTRKKLLFKQGLKSTFFTVRHWTYDHLLKLSTTKL